MVNLDDKAIRKAVKKILHYTRLLHMLKLIRWYGKKMFNGNYNKKSFFSILDQVESQKKQIDGMLSKCYDDFPRVEYFKKQFVVPKKKTDRREALDKGLSFDGSPHKKGLESFPSREEVKEKLPPLKLNYLIGDHAEPQPRILKRRTISKDFSKIVEASRLKQKSLVMMQRIISSDLRNENQALDDDIIRDLYTNIDIPYTTDIENSLFPHRYYHEVDMGEGQGGIYTMLQVIYLATIFRRQELDEELERQDQLLIMSNQRAQEAR